MSNNEFKLNYTKKEFPSSILTSGIIIFAIGLVLAVASYLVDPIRASYNSLITMMFGFSIVIGLVFIIGIEHLVGAVWSVPFRRIAEHLSGIIFIVPLFSIPVLLNFQSVFHWSQSSVIVKDAVIAGKSPYLNITFFIIRFILAIGVFLYFLSIFLISLNNCTREWLLLLQL